MTQRITYPRNTSLFGTLGKMAFLSSACVVMLLTAGCGKKEEVPSSASFSMNGSEQQYQCPTLCPNVSGVSEETCEAIASSHRCMPPKLQSRIDAQKLNDSVNLSSANLSTPFTDYIQLETARQLAVLYYVVTGKAYDSAKETSKSHVLENTQDVFKKKDLQAVIDTDFKNEIAASAGEKQKYRKFFVDTPLKTYDSTVGGFPVDVMAPDMKITLPKARDMKDDGKEDSATYSIAFTNWKDFSVLKPKDEAQARQIESLRAAAYPPLRARIYVYLQGANVTNDLIKAQVTRIEILNAKEDIVLAK